MRKIEILIGTLFILIILSMGQVDEYLIRTITTDELIKINFDNLKPLDSVTAYSFYSKYPLIHNWERYVLVLRISETEDYIKANFEHERKQSIREFMERHEMYKFNLGTKLNHEALITKTKKISDEWSEVNYRLILTKVGNRVDTAILVGEYTHSLGVSEFTEKSITNFYSNNSVDFIKTSDFCGDVVLDNKIHCDSTRETTKYRVDNKLKKVTSTKSVDRYPYNYEFRR
jgi:hypothetical protein